MKKIITLLCISFFTLVSCSSNEDAPIVVPSATAAQAELVGGSINIAWPAVAGAGITYNIYRNDNPVKINTAPLTEAKFTDVLTATGSYTYTITVNLSGLESPKGLASEKVVLALPKTRVRELINSSFITKYETTYTYDASNIAKLVSTTTKTTSTKVSDQSVTVTNSTIKYTYMGDLITKVTYYNVDNLATSSNEYEYNTKNQLASIKKIKADGSVDYTINFDYKDNGTIIESSSVDYYGTYVHYYQSGNIVKQEYSKDNSFMSTNFVFDTKNVYTKNILGYNTTFTSSINNEVSYVTTGANNSSTRAVYAYDANDYVLTKTVYRTTSSIEILIEKTVYTYN
jgi:hypothetical protein